jgi:alanyl-tRNA synthetase
MFSKRPFFSRKGRTDRDTGFLNASNSVLESWIRSFNNGSLTVHKVKVLDGCFGRAKRSRFGQCRPSQCDPKNHTARISSRTLGRFWRARAARRVARVREVLRFDFTHFDAMTQKQSKRSKRS